MPHTVLQQLNALLKLENIPLSCKKSISFVLHSTKSPLFTKNNNIEMKYNEKTCFLCNLAMVRVFFHIEYTFISILNSPKNLTDV